MARGKPRDGNGRAELISETKDVHVFAVDPRYQGRGAGTALVRALVDLGNSSSLPVYLESSPGTEKLYYRMGFRRLPGEMGRVVHDAEVVGTERNMEVPLMVRLPDQGAEARERMRDVGRERVDLPGGLDDWLAAH